MSSPSFALKKPTNQSLFHPAANIDLTGIGESIINISPDKLKHYHNHPFKLYKGERLNDMVESIKANGILIPLLIRPVPEGGPNEYEVLAGHNRLESGKIAGLTEMPCIVKDGLTDEEAHLIVTESNLVQRSFSDLSHSERAEALSTHYNAIKHQGKRTDLIRQMEALLSSETADNPGNAQNPDNGANTPMGNKSIDVTGEKYGLSRNSVARYIRVNTLIAGLKELLDSEELSIRAGVSLSFMVDERQQAVLGQMQRYDVGVSMKQAEQLRLLNAEANKDEENSGEMFLLGCADILLGRNAYEKETKPTKAIRFKLDRSAMEPYFTEEDTEEDIQETILEALEFYHQYRNQVSSQQD